MLYFFYRFFFFNDTATTEIYTLSLHDALPICVPRPRGRSRPGMLTEDPGGCGVSRREFQGVRGAGAQLACPRDGTLRSEEHTSELQSRQYLVCRLLLEKKKSLK